VDSEQFPATANPYEPSAVEDESNLGSSRSRGQLDAAGSTQTGPTRTGLLMIYYGIVAFLAGLVLTVIVGVGMFSNLSPGSSPAGSSPAGIAGALSIGLLIPLALVLIGAGVAFLGKVVCLFGGKLHGGNTPLLLSVLASLFLFLLNLLEDVFVGLLLTAFNAPEFVVVATVFLTVVKYTLTVAGYVLFLVYLKRLTEYLGKVDLVNQASSLIRLVITVAVLTVVIPFPVVFFSLSIGAGTFVTFVLGLIAVVTLVVTFVKYCNYLKRVADSMRI